MKNEESHNKHIKNVKTRQPATNSPRSFFLFPFPLKSSTFAPAFRVIAGRKIGELPVMLRWNDTAINNI